MTLIVLAILVWTVHIVGTSMHGMQPDLPRGPALPLKIRHIGRRVLLATLLVYLGTAGGSLTTTDAVVAYDLTRSLVERRTISLSGDMVGDEAYRGSDGRYYSPFGLAQSLYGIPFYLAGRTIAQTVGRQIGNDDTIPKATVALGSGVAAALSVWLIFLFAWRLTRDVRGAVYAAVALGFGTSLWPYAKFGFNAPLAALALSGASYSLWTGTRTGSRRHLVGGGLWFGVALLTRHELALAVIPASIWLWIEAEDNRSRFRAWMRDFLPGVLAGAGVWLVYNAVRFGTPWDPGYLREAISVFGGSVVPGLSGLLVSPGTSIFLYSPIALVGILASASLWRRDRRMALFCGVLCTVFLVFYATLSNWAGGRSYGPRYLVPLLPFLCLPLASLVADKRRTMVRRVLFGTLVLSVAVQLPGVLVDYSRESIAFARTVDAEELSNRLYSWHSAPLVLNARAAATALPRNLTFLLGLAEPPSVNAQAPRGEFSQQFTFSLDFWWIYLFHLRVLSAQAAMAVGATLLGGAILFWTGLLRLMSKDSSHAYVLAAHQAQR